MLLFLTLILFMITVIAFAAAKGDALSPAFGACASFFVCSALALSHEAIWNLPMRFNTVVILLLLLLFFIFGAVLANWCFDAGESADVAESRLWHPLTISWSVWLALSVILCGFFMMNYHDFLEMARSVTNSERLSDMLSAVIHAKAYNEAKFDRWYQYRNYVSLAVAYISVFAFWQNALAARFVQCAKFAWLATLYVPFIAVTGGREAFLPFSIFIVVSFLLLYRKKHIGESTHKRELSVIAFGVVLFLLMFFVTGLLNGKIHTEYGLLRVLAHYAGTNIPAFDLFINEKYIPEEGYMLTQCFRSIYGNLVAVGILPVNYDMYFTTFFEGFVWFEGISTNVYTALQRYIQDFGYTGCAAVMFLLGFTYSGAYIRVRTGGYQAWAVILYSFFVHPIFHLGRDERLFNHMARTSTVYELFIMAAFYVLLVWTEKRRKIS